MSKVPDWLVVWDFKEGMSFLGVARRYGLRVPEVDDIVRQFRRGRLQQYRDRYRVGRRSPNRKTS